MNSHEEKNTDRKKRGKWKQKKVCEGKDKMA